MGHLNRLFLFDSIAEAQRYLKQGRLPGAHDTVVATPPAVRSFLAEKGIRAESTLPYFTSESHAAALEKSSRIVDWLYRNADFVDLSAGIKDANRESFISWLRFSIHHCLWVIEFVSNAADKNGPDLISASSSPKRYISSLFIESEEKYFGLIASRIAAEGKIGFEDISGKIRESRLTGLKDFFARQYFLLRYILSHLKFVLFRLEAIAAKMSNPGKGLIFYSTRSCGLGKLAAEIRREHDKDLLILLKGPVMSSVDIPDFLIKLFCGKSSGEIIRQKELNKALMRKIEGERDLFSYKGVFFGDIISKKIENNIGGFIVGQLVWARMLDRFFRRVSPKAIFSCGARHDELILAAVCGGLKIDSILISHGSHVRPKNKYEHIEWGEHGKTLLRMPFSTVILQSPLEAEYLKTFPANGKTVCGGPLLWGRPVNKANGSRVFNEIFGGRYQRGVTKVICHAGTSKRNKNPRFHIYETPDEYIQAIKDAALAVEGLQDCVLIVRVRPRSDISVDAIRWLVPFSEKVVLSYKEDFSDILGITDLLVSFSSTTIEEAFQNRIPVLLYGGEGRYQHVAASEVNRNASVQPAAVYHVKSAELLGYAMMNILRLHSGRDAHSHLFDQYVYPHEKRVSPADLLRKGTVK